MGKSSKIAVLLMMILTIAISGCSPSDIDKPAAGSGSLVVSMDLAGAKALSNESGNITVSVTVTKNGQTKSQEALVANGRAAVSFPNLAAGQWAVSAKIMDGGYVAYEGSGNAFVKEYEATELSISMALVPSDLVVTVSKPSDMVITKGSVTLTDPSGVYPVQRGELGASLTAEFKQIKPVLWQIKIDVSTSTGKTVSGSGQVLLRPGRRNTAEISLSSGSGSLGINLSYEAQSRYSASGYVYDITKPAAPLPDAAVNIGSASAKTDANGWFAISSIPAGEYEITIDKAGYQRHATWLRDSAGSRGAADELPSAIRINSDGNMLTLYAIPVEESSANYGTIRLRASAIISGQAAYNTYADVDITDISTGRKAGSYSLPLTNSQWSGGTTTLTFDGKVPVKSGTYSLKISLPVAVTSRWDLPAVNHIYSGTNAGINVVGGQTYEPVSITLSDTVLPQEPRGTLKFTFTGTPNDYIYLDIYKAGEMAAGLQPVKRLAGTGSQVFRDMTLPIGSYDIIAYTLDGSNASFSGITNRAASYSLAVKENAITACPVAWKALPKIKVMYPLDGAAGVSPVPTVSWQRIAGAKSYLVSIGGWIAVTEDPFITYGKTPAVSGLAFPASPLKAGSSYGISIAATSLPLADAALRVLSASSDYYLSILGYADTRFSVAN